MPELNLAAWRETAAEYAPGHRMILNRLCDEVEAARAERDAASAPVVRLAVDLARQTKRANDSAVQLIDTLVQRDRARDIAAALEGENAELRGFASWIGEHRFPSDMTDADVVDTIMTAATAVLARTEPTRGGV
jgi:hypothetical protein